ncbi:Pre-mRNA splicing factor, putative (macronuclear) [Tetrahymena thermophila SB210]|uniref:Pre-mRNA splicing factor, putative n=1 Tax=Tetrahymena thermophila (strain SB210) TaxID=312017 RepID=Q23R62_TETTS|nr:Pre-mRNA splicing factor, putative [Tetrahymena thermophila SB210]EAR98979.1 Pre-mRNA splicing factor, putative [Tetrahymena thermophila SB210]|eukprot:XP_001019224.1 Pre-mRNA splicing factor, putative [Tetrahymena thermophila SB210]
MSNKSYYAKTDFGPPPPNYVAGLARGAVGFITRSDIGPANYSSYDSWSGYQENIFANDKQDDEDRQAEEEYNKIDNFMAGRRIKYIEKKQQEEAKKNLEKNPSVAFQFADLKRDLGGITYDEWNAIPEVQDYTIKKSKNEKYTPVPDHIIQSARSEGSFSTSLDVTGLQTPHNINDIGKANQTIFTSRLDKSSDQVSGISTVDKSGYLTSLNSQLVNSSADIGDFKRARNLMKSFVKTDPKNPVGWISVARVEELDGKIQEARNVLYQGLPHCETSDEIWVEIARLETPEKARALLAKAATILPKSLKIWLAAADLESNREMKVKILKKALEHIPDQPRLWKKLIEYEESQKEAKILLYKAVECIPDDLDMWLALAKLETYENAKAVLNKARKIHPQELSIWVNAAKLEESQGQPQETITKVLQNAIKYFSSKNINIVKEDWLKEAAYCEKSGNLNTCIAIVQAIVLHNVHDKSDKERIIKEEAKNMIEGTCIGTGRAIYEFGIEALKPDNIDLFQATIDFEQNTGKDKDNLKRLYKEATTQHPKYESFWIQRIKFHWQEANKVIEQAQLQNHSEKNIETPSTVDEEAQMNQQITAQKAEIQKLLQESQENLPESQQILVLSIKYLKKNEEIDQARELVYKARKNNPTHQVYLSLLKLEYQTGALQKAFQESQNAMGAFPNCEKIFILSAKIAYAHKSIEQARQVYEKGLRFNPMSVSLIQKYVELEINHKYFARARPVLEKFRVKLPKNPELWCTAVQLEIEAENKKGARYMLARALKECPDYTQLWSYAIELEPKATRKKKTSEALEKCRQDPYVNVSVAKLFWKERKMDKARKWIEKSTFERPEIMDSWAALYLLVLETEGRQQADEVLIKVKQLDVHREGRLYQKIKKSDDGWRYSFDQIFIKITDQIKKELSNIE